MEWYLYQSTLSESGFFICPVALIIAVYETIHFQMNTYPSTTDTISFALFWPCLMIGVRITGDTIVDDLPGDKHPLSVTAFQADAGLILSK